jgi:hypothetical protein
MKKFCNANCRSAYHSDRAHGLLYSPIGIRREDLPKSITFVPLSEKNNDIMLFGHEDGCKIAKICTYCLSPLYPGK